MPDWLAVVAALLGGGVAAGAAFYVLGRRVERRAAVAAAGAAARESERLLEEARQRMVLAALDITNELFQTKKGEREVAARLAALADDMTKLLPPGKRKALSHQASGIS